MGYDLRFVAVVMGVAVLSGCASAMPEQSTERALYSDLRKIVETRQRTDWFLDRKEIEDVAPTALRSTCVVSKGTHAGLRSWLDAEIKAQGGSAEALFEAKGRDLDEIDEILTLERTRALLEYAREHLDECPFWVSEEEDFAGIHSNTDRFVLLLESNGGGSLVFTDGEVGFGGEGGGRLLFGWGVGDRATVAFGGEVGGRGAFGQGDQALSATVTVGVPLLLRLHNLSTAVDLELEPTATSDPATFDPRFGVRLTVAAGLSTVRVGAFMPTLMGMLNYEVQPATDELPVAHIFRIGTRFSIGYDP